MCFRKHSHMKLWEWCTLSHFCLLFGSCIGSNWAPQLWYNTLLLCASYIVRLKHSWQYTAPSLKCLSQLGFESHTFFPPGMPRLLKNTLFLLFLKYVRKEQPCIHIQNEQSWIWCSIQSVCSRSCMPYDSEIWSV